MSVWLILIIVLFIVFIYKSHFNSSSFQSTKCFKFNNTKGNLTLGDIQIGKKVNLWNKAGTNEIYVFLIGADHWIGSIGNFHNQHLSSMLQSNTKLRIRGIIKSISASGTICLEENLIYKY